MTSSIGAVQDGLGSTLGTSTSAAKDATNAAKDATMNGLKASTDLVKDSMNQVPGVSQVSDIGTKSLSTVDDTLKQVPGVNNAMDMSKGLTDSLLGATKMTTGFFVESTQKVSGGVLSTGKTFMDTGMDGINATVDQSMSGVNKFGGAVGDSVKVLPGGDAMVDAGKSFTSPMMDGVSKGTSMMTEGVQATGGGLLDTASMSNSMLEEGAMGSFSSLTEITDTLGFQSVMGNMFKNVDTSDEGLEKMFKELDADGSGKVDAAEMKAAITKVYGEGLKDEVLDTMMKAADSDGDGEVDIDEFKKIMRAGPA